jgi:hypothetical protein
MIALSLFVNYMIARSFVQTSISPSKIAHQLGTQVIPLKDVKQKTDDAGYSYFVHGTHTFEWIYQHNISGNVGRDDTDFGRGFYTFPLSDFRSLGAATEWALRKSSQIEFLDFSLPIINLIKKTLSRIRQNG